MFFHECIHLAARRDWPATLHGNTFTKFGWHAAITLFSGDRTDWARIMFSLLNCLISSCCSSSSRCSRLSCRIYCALSCSNLSSCRRYRVPSCCDFSFSKCTRPCGMWLRSSGTCLTKDTCRRSSAWKLQHTRTTRYLRPRRSAVFILMTCLLRLLTFQVHPVLWHAYGRLRF